MREKAKFVQMSTRCDIELPKRLLNFPFSRIGISTDCFSEDNELFFTIIGQTRMGFDTLHLLSFLFGKYFSELFTRAIKCSHFVLIHTWELGNKLLSLLVKLRTKKQHTLANFNLRDVSSLKFKLPTIYTVNTYAR